jgi:hypothetical protein
VSETGVTGYTATITGDCAADGSVTLNPGDVKSCTITNDDVAAKLTVTKIVVNDNGGSKQVGDFPLFVDATSVSSGVQNSFDAGPHSVSETGATGYAGTISGDCAADGSITLNPGDVKACTITNDDQPAKLTVTKLVVNDNGGTKLAGAFSLFVDATSVTSGVQSTVNAGPHTVSETADPGYAATIGGDCGTNGSINLNPGEVKACTITNDDIQPRLNVIKTVVGGVGVLPSAFTITVTGSSPSPASFPGSSGQLVMLNAGSYNVTETTVSPYVGTFSADCSGTIAVGQTKTCTITNGVATRSSQGFWSTHFDFANATWLAIPAADRNWCSGAKDMGNAPPPLLGAVSADVKEMEGGFWSSISKLSLGLTKRSPIDQARMQLAQQLLAAMLNKQAFAAPDGGLIASGKAAYCGTSIPAIQSAANALEQYNTSGETVPFPPGVTGGATDPKKAQANANMAFWDVLP